MASRAILVIPISRDRLSILPETANEGRTWVDRGSTGAMRSTFDMIASFGNFHEHSGVTRSSTMRYLSLAPVEVRLRDEIVGGSIGRVFSFETKSVAR